MGQNTEDRANPDFEVVEGAAGFAARAAEMIAVARMEVAIFSQALDRRVFGGPELVEQLKKFALQHERARARILVRSPERTMAAGAHRMVEFGRALTSRIEFRDLPDHLAQRSEYVVCDGRVLLYRGASDQLAAKYYPASPHVARLQLQEFDSLWNQSEPAQELRNLRL